MKDVIIGLSMFLSGLMMISIGIILLRIDSGIYGMVGVAGVISITIGICMVIIGIVKAMTDGKGE